MKSLPALQSETKTQISLRHSLRGKLLLFFLSLSLLPLIIVSGVSYWESQQAMHTRISDELQRLAQIEANSINAWLGDRLAEVEVMAGSGEARSMEPKQLSEALALYAQKWDHYQTLFVAGLDGNSIASNDGAQLKVADRDYFQKALKGEPNISDALISKATGEVIMVVAVPVIVKDQVVGVVACTITTAEIFDILSGARTGQTGEAFLINRDGYMITPSRFTDDLKQQGLIKEHAELELKLDTVGAHEVLAGKSGIGEYLDYRGEAVMGAYAPIESMGWGLLVKEDATEAMAMETRLRNIIVSIGLVTAVIVVGLGVFVARSIARPIIQVTEAARKLATGDVNQSVAIKGRDEIAAMAASFQQMIAYLQDMAGAANRLAQGDLTAQVTPQSAQDVLGQAFVQMIANLRQLIGQVADNANSVGTASNQLSAVADQAGQATNQIAQTMQQIASGAQQQTMAITKTASSMEQMARAIDGVATGAQDQAHSITQTAQAVSDLTGSVRTIANGTEAQAGAVSEAKTAGQALETAVEQISHQTDQVAEFIQANLHAAQSGQQAAREAVASMDQLGAATDQLAQRIRDLGKRSAQIGAIVQTIDEIASQTNLLALNAAIEAARAGEHGKGFAVVADEVRKLAERSSQATKEIREMIQMVQSGAESTVEAMNQAGSDVQTGVSLTRQAGTAFEVIASGAADSAGQVKATLEAIKAVQKSAEQLAQAINAVEQVATQNRSLASQMESAAQAAGELVDQVSAVIEENTAATEEMAASSGEVTQAIEDISSVSEENSAAVEEVSASAEEMSAQVQEVTASAQTLSQMAIELQALVNNFKLAADENLQDKIELCKEAHLRWVSRLNDMLAGNIVLQVDQIGSHTECILGKWYYSRGRAEWGNLPEYAALEAPHTQLHEMVRNAVVAYHRGDHGAVRAYIKEVEYLSQEVVGLLDRLERQGNGSVHETTSQPFIGVTPVRSGNGQYDKNLKLTIKGY